MAARPTQFAGVEFDGAEVVLGVNESGLMGIAFDSHIPEEVEATCVIEDPNSMQWVALFVHPGGVFTRETAGGVTVLAGRYGGALPPTGGRTWSEQDKLSATLPPWVAMKAWAPWGRTSSFGFVDVSGETVDREAIGFGLATTHGLTGMVGHGEAGKTMLLTAMAVEHPSQQPLPAQPVYPDWTEPRVVLYLDAEGHTDDVKQRWAAMGLDVKKRPRLVDLTTHDDLHEPGGRVALARLVQRSGSVVIVDSLPGLLRLAGIAGEQPGKVATFLTDLFRPAAREGKAVLLADLPARRDREALRPRGAGRWETYDVVWSVRCEVPFAVGKSGSFKVAPAAGPVQHHRCTSGAVVRGPRRGGSAGR